MAITLSPDDSVVFKAVGTFVGSINGLQAVQGQSNRVPETASDDFVVMTIARRERLSTNNDNEQDAAFTASVTTNVLTVTALLIGSVVLGRPLFATGIADGVLIQSQSGGAPGGIGTYVLSAAAGSPVASETMAAGARTVTQAQHLVMQLDVHGADFATAGTNAAMISTLFRDPYGYDALVAVNPAVTPLHADEPRQMPFINAEQQYETRWVVEAHLEVNQSVTIPQQFADQLALNVVSVEATYPP